MRIRAAANTRYFGLFPLAISLLIGCSADPSTNDIVSQIKAGTSASTTSSSTVGSQAGMRTDVNQDGRGDAVVVYPQNNTVNLYTAKGTASGSFQSSTSFDSKWSWSDQAQFLVSDVNGDWKSDVVMVYPDGGSAVGLYTAIGKADGSFQPGVHFSTGWGWNASSKYLTGDVNGDGYGDTILVYPDGGTQVGLYTAAGKSDGGFSLGARFAPGWAWSAAAKYFVDDVNGDGLDDVILVYPNNGTAVGIYTAKGNSSAGFDVGATFAPGWEWNTSSSYFIGDVNGDGYRDVVLVHADNGTRVGLYSALGNASGGFGQGPATPFSTWSWNSSAKYLLADVNGDRRSDIVLIYPDASTKLALGTTAGGFDAGVSTTLSGWTSGPYYASNITGDSKSDVVRVSSSSGKVRLQTAVSGSNGLKTATAFVTSVSWNAKNKYLVGGHPQRMPRFQLSAWVDVDLQTTVRGYVTHYNASPEETAPGVQDIHNAMVQLRDVYHSNLLYLNYHRSIELQKAKDTFAEWKRAQTTKGTPVLVPGLLLQDYYCDPNLLQGQPCPVPGGAPGCNFTNAELATFVQWLAANVNSRAIAVFDVYPDRSLCGQLDTIAQNFPGEIIRLGIQPSEALAPQFASAVADVYGPIAVGKTNAAWQSQCPSYGYSSGQAALEGIVANRVPNSKIAWIFPVVGYDFSVDVACGQGDTGGLLENTTPGRNKWLAHNSIVAQYLPGGGAHTNWSGFSVSLDTVNIYSGVTDPTGSRLYDAMKQNSTYAGYYSPALNEVADIFRAYNP